jgi:hypothetical protein
MNSHRNIFRSTVVHATVFLIISVCFMPACFAIDATEASNAINKAEQDLNGVYVKVAEADSAGANVSALLNKLGNAADYLSEAWAAFSIGDYDTAIVLATKCSDAAKSVADEATHLGLSAEEARSNMILSIVVVSGVGIGLVLVFGFLGWRLLKRWYFRRVLDMKPEVGGAQ